MAMHASMDDMHKKMKGMTTGMAMVCASCVLVTASSGPDDIEAPLVADPTGGLPNAFLGMITPGAEDTAEYGFAIPFSSLNRVRVSVDLGDGTHEPVTFAGAVEREQ